MVTAIAALILGALVGYHAGVRHAGLDDHDDDESPPVAWEPERYVGRLRD